MTTRGIFYFGGNSEMRGYDYRTFVGDTGWFGNAELRFPLIDAMATPIGILGGVRGVFFFDIGGAWYNNLPFTFSTSDDEAYRPIINYVYNPANGFFDPVYAPTQTISGFRLRDGRASYGFGLQTSAMGIQMHYGLGVAHPVQQAVGRRALCVPGRVRLVPPQSLPVLDRVRLLGWTSVAGSAEPVYRVPRARNPSTERFRSMPTS